MAHKPNQVNPFGGESSGAHASSDPSTPPPYPARTSTEEIRDDIARTRAEMDQTVDALQERLRPRHLLDDVLEWIRSPAKGDGNGSSAVDTAKDIGQKVVDKLKQHPMPAALIGAGLTWLLFEGDSSGKTRADYTRGKWDVADYSGSYVDARTGRPYNAEYGDDAQRPGGARGATGPCPPGMTGMAAGGGAATHEGPGFTERTKNAVSGAAESVTDSASSAAGKVSEWAGSARDSAYGMGRSAQHYAADASEQLRRGYHSGKHYLERGMEQYPLAMGAAAMALGVLSGLLLPHTQTEDRWMGDEADEVKRRAADAGEEALERGKHMAEAAKSAAKDEASRQGAQPGTVVEKAKRVAEDVKDSAAEAAKREGVDPDSLAEKGKRVAERAKDAAKDEAKRQSDGGMI